MLTRLLPCLLQYSDENEVIRHMLWKKRNIEYTLNKTKTVEQLPTSAVMDKELDAAPMQSTPEEEYTVTTTSTNTNPVKEVVENADGSQEEEEEEMEKYAIEHVISASRIIMDQMMESDVVDTTSLGELLSHTAFCLLFLPAFTTHEADLEEFGSVFVSTLKYHKSVIFHEDALWNNGLGMDVCTQPPLIYIYTLLRLGREIRH